MNYAGLIAQNAKRWQTAKLTRASEFKPVARRLVAAKERYKEIELLTGVPWFVIAVIHEREASQLWDRNIAQGDPWNRKSVRVPKGRGPFTSWKDAAIDALSNCKPYAAKWKNWTPGGAMTLLELYNGLGYYNKGKPSPYVWSGTDQYAIGKYVSDGVYNPNVVDKQLGCAGLILAMKALDPTIKLDGETPAPPDIQPSEPETKPAIKSKSIWASIVAALTTAGTAFVDALGDWRVWAAVIVLLLLAYIVWERNGKPDIRGWFR